jgi:hypothetical protein
VFPADPTAIRQVLPTGLHPARLPDGRPLVIVQAVRFHELTDQHMDGPTLLGTPYAEVVVGVLTSRRRGLPMLPGLPLAPGVFPLAMPLTSREARDPGLAMGLPKFIADLEFEDDVARRSVVVSEGGRDILRLVIDVDGPMRPRLQRQSWFSVFNGRLHEVRARTFAYSRIRIGRQLGELRLGSHPVADELRELGVSDRPIASLVAPFVRALMPAPVPLGVAMGRDAYRGRDLDFGHYTVRHPHTDAIDQYGPVGLAATAAAAGVRPPTAARGPAVVVPLPQATGA